MPLERVKQTTDGTAGKEEWTAIGVTAETKVRLATLKQGFEQMLKQGPKTWDYFLKALLDLGPLTWKFLIDETVKSIEASMRGCPLPTSPVMPSESRNRSKPARQ